MCRRTFDGARHEVVSLAVDAARTHTFDEKSPHLTLAQIVRRSYGNEDTVNQALEEGWKLGVDHSMADHASHEKSTFEYFRPSLNEKPAPQGGLSCNVTSAN